MTASYVAQTPAEGRAKRNENRLKILLCHMIEEEIDRVQNDMAAFRHAARNQDRELVVGQLDHYRNMITALRTLKSRFKPNTSRNVPQEERNRNAETTADDS